MPALRHDQTQKAVQGGDLVEDSSDQLRPDYEITDVARAGEAVESVREFLQNCSEDFEQWFRDEYGGPSDLRKRRIFDGVIG